MDNIDNFEQTLQKQGLGRSMDEDDGEGGEIPHKTEPKSMVSAVATMTRIKEKKQRGEFMRKERDKRRRKMIVDQSKLQREIEVQKREQLILEKLKQQSKQEKEIEYEIWRSQQCKQIILQNRDLRDQKYKEKHEVNIINAKYKEEEMLKVKK